VFVGLSRCSSTVCLFMPYSSQFSSNLHQTLRSGIGTYVHGRMCQVFKVMGSRSRSSCNDRENHVNSIARKPLNGYDEPKLRYNTWKIRISISG